MIASDLIINDNNNDIDDNNDDRTLISRLYIKLDSSNNYNNDDDVDGDDNSNDDDINVKRRKRNQHEIIPITLCHYRLTSLDDVGLQLWRASLLLGDYLIYMYTTNDTNDTNILELGCGIGLLSIIVNIINDRLSSSSSSSSSSMRIKRSYFTDMKKDIVQLAATNTNRYITTTNGSMDTSNAMFRVLDWSLEGYPLVSTTTTTTSSTDNNDNIDYLWNPSDINYLLSNKISYFAADIIYDDTITLNFMKKLNEVLKNNDKCFIAIEKRYNYSIENMDIVANGYDYFLSFFNNFNNNSDDNPINDIKLHAECINISVIPQYILNYERGNDLEMYIVYK